jgi:hypothetical protein
MWNSGMSWGNSMVRVGARRKVSYTPCGLCGWNRGDLPVQQVGNSLTACHETLRPVFKDRGQRRERGCAEQVLLPVGQLYSATCTILTETDVRSLLSPMMLESFGKHMKLVSLSGRHLRR